MLLDLSSHVGSRAVADEPAFKEDITQRSIACVLFPSRRCHKNEGLSEEWKPHDPVEFGGCIARNDGVDIMMHHRIGESRSEAREGRYAQRYCSFHQVRYQRGADGGCERIDHSQPKILAFRQSCCGPDLLDSTFGAKRNIADMGQKHAAGLGGNQWALLSTEQFGSGLGLGTLYRL